MKQIKFSHDYNKLEGAKFARLLQVVPVKLEDLSPEFLAYDTDNGRFQLPKQGDYLMLLFNHEGTWSLFTTIRRNTPEKLRYYQATVGEEFEIIIKLKPIDTHHIP